MPSHAPYSIDFQPINKLESLRQDKEVFALVQHTNQTRVSSDDPLDFEINLPNLGEELVEVWRSKQTMTAGVIEQVNFKHCDTFIFGNILLDESEFEDLTLTTKVAYQRIHDTLEATGFPALLRIWNAFPRINVKDQELERYRSFCMGRHQALDAWHYIEEQLPAASAVGSKEGKLLIHFIAARQPGVQIENPRQISAYHYPTRYGPKSPSFSRATLKNWGKEQHLYISGTASIVGHETRHLDDQVKQLEETLTNISTIIDQANNMYALPCSKLSDLDAVRVYIRNTEHTGFILETLQKTLGNKCLIQAVHGDICRSDLLLEIEGYYTH